MEKSPYQVTWAVSVETTNDMGYFCETTKYLTISKVDMGWFSCNWYIQAAVEIAIYWTTWKSHLEKRMRRAVFVNNPSVEITKHINRGKQCILLTFGTSFFGPQLDGICLLALAVSSDLVAEHVWKRGITRVFTRCPQKWSRLCNIKLF